MEEKNSYAFYTKIIVNEFGKDTPGILQSRKELTPTHKINQ